MFTEPLFYDIIIFSYLTLLAFLIKEKFERMNSGWIKFLMGLSPYLLIIGLASASFAAGTQAFTILLSVFLSSTLYFIVFKTCEIPKRDIYGALLGYLQLIALIFYLQVPFNLILLFRIFSMAFVPIIVPVLLIAFLMPKEIRSVYPVYTHFLDASSTVIALNYGLIERIHLAQLFIKNFGAYGVFLMKLLIVGPLAFYLSRNYERSMERKVFFLVSIYGIILSFRNYFLILLTAPS